MPVSSGFLRLCSVDLIVYYIVCTDTETEREREREKGGVKARPQGFSPGAI